LGDHFAWLVENTKALGVLVIRVVGLCVIPWRGHDNGGGRSVISFESLLVSVTRLLLLHRADGGGVLRVRVGRRAARVARPPDGAPRATARVGRQLPTDLRRQARVGVGGNSPHRRPGTRRRAPV